MRFPAAGRSGTATAGQSRALVCGCGALGSAAANTLVRAGVGSVRIVDRDVVELGNLQRQVLFDEQDAREGLPEGDCRGRKTPGGQFARSPSSRSSPTSITRNVERFCAGHGRARRRHGQFRDAVSAERRGRPPRPALGLRRLRGRRRADDDHRAGSDALPAVPVARLPAAGKHAHLRNGRHPGADRAASSRPSRPSRRSRSSADNVDADFAGLTVVDLWTGRIRQMDVAGLRRRGRLPELQAAGVFLAGRAQAEAARPSFAAATPCS